MNVLHSRALRHSILAVWLAVVATALYLWIFQRDFIESELQGALSTSTVMASIIYLALGAFRAFTFVPATFLLLVALPFFSPALLLGLTLIGIVISSSSCYFFANALRLDEMFERKYPRQIKKLTAALQRRPMAVTIGWSFLLFLPTDLICYVCGSLRINYVKSMTGVLIGEGTVYAIYIYAAAWLFSASV